MSSYNRRRVQVNDSRAGSYAWVLRNGLCEGRIVVNSGRQMEVKVLCRSDEEMAR